MHGVTVFDERLQLVQENFVAGTPVSHGGEVDRLLAEARTLLDEGFITEPTNANAVVRLLEALALDPGNGVADELLKGAAERLADVAREAYDAGLVEDAKHYLELALAVTPDVEAWQQLRARWEMESELGVVGA